MVTLESLATSPNLLFLFVLTLVTFETFLFTLERGSFVSRGEQIILVSLI